MENVVATEQSTRAAVMREMRAYFEPFELIDGMFDTQKLPSLTKRWYVAVAARHAFWAMSQLEMVSARVGHLCEATEYLTVAVRMVQPEYAEEARWTQNWIALAKSYLREDIAKFVKPAFRKLV